MNERGLQNKSDSTASKWENSDFPVLCQACLGTSGFVRMVKDTFGGACKMCSRPFTVFKWRPARGEYKKTEVCQTCSKVKNICQTCILDLEFGLPSQLRDAVLAEFEGTSVIPQSEVNREYFVQQQIVAMANGDDMWSTRDNPNERLLKMARTVTKDREQSRIKLPPPTSSSSSSSNNYSVDATKRSFSDAFVTSDDEQQQQHQAMRIPLPPGINSVAELQLYYAGQFNPEPAIAPAVEASNSIVTDSSIGSSSSTTGVVVGTEEAIKMTAIIPSLNASNSCNNNNNILNSQQAQHSISTIPPQPLVNNKPGANKPPKPAGPPPLSAFKNKKTTTNDTSTISSSVTVSI